MSVALATSCLLFALAFPLILSRGGELVQTGVDKAGVLQLTWLVGNEYRLRQLSTPTDTELRAAGMYEVNMDEMSHRREEIDRKSEKADSV